MFRSRPTALVVAAVATVLATSVVSSGRAGAVREMATARSHPESGPGMPGPRAGSPLQRPSSRMSWAPGSGGGAVGRSGAGPGTSPGDRARWRWPLVLRPPVLRAFRAPLSAYGAGHRGLDLSAADGTSVLVVEGGVVTHAGRVAGRGTVTVAHADGLSSTYEPLDPTVRVGQVVSLGDVLGTLRARDGPGHCGPRVCLHLGARRGESYLDPYPLLAGGRPVLLPLR